MAEICLDCYNKYWGNKNLTEKDIIADIDFCEECGELKPCIIRIKEKNIFKRIVGNIKRFSRRLFSIFRK